MRKCIGQIESSQNRVVHCFSVKSGLVADLIVLDRGKADRLPTLGFVVEREAILREKYRIIVKIVCDISAMRGNEAVEPAGSSAVIQRQIEARHFKADRQRIFDLETFGQNVDLQRANHPDNCR